MSWYPKNLASPSWSMPCVVIYVNKSPPVDNSKKICVQGDSSAYPSTRLMLGYTSRSRPKTSSCVQRGNKDKRTWFKPPRMFTSFITSATLLTLIVLHATWRCFTASNPKCTVAKCPLPSVCDVITYSPTVFSNTNPKYRH